MRTLPFYILTACAVAAIFTGCDANVRTQCENVLKAIATLQPQHLTASSEFNAEDFRKAELVFLKRHAVKVPQQSNSSTPLKECMAALELGSAANPKASVEILALELLQYYMYMWDPHTVILSEKELSDDSSVFHTGYGLTIARLSDYGKVKIVGVIAGSPGDNAGLQEGMFIHSINHRDVKQMSWATIIDMVSNKDSGQLVLGIQEAGQPLHEVTVLQATFPVLAVDPPDLIPTTRNLNVGYLKVHSFSVDGSFVAGLKKVKSSAALILDLRDIDGGDVLLAAQMGDLLIPNSVAFAGILKKNSKIDLIKFKNPSRNYDGPLIVLVNAKTKSSTEVLAGALQDYGAIVVGSPTYGKGTQQNKRDLSKFDLQGGAYLTDAFLVRPSGKLIQLRGIIPDVLIPSALPESFEKDRYRAIVPPDDRSPLSGYDPSSLPIHSEHFREDLQKIQTEITQLARTNATSNRDWQLEAAKRVAEILVQESDD